MLGRLARRLQAKPQIAAGGFGTWMTIEENTMSYGKPLALGMLLACVAMATGAFAQDSMQSGRMQSGSMQNSSTMMHEHDKMMDHGMSKMFDAMDTDHDGYVSQAEHAAFMATMFRKADANGDGKLSKEEMRNAMENMMHHHMAAMQH